MVTNVEKFTAPVWELNALSVKNIEKLAELGLKSMEENTALAIESMKEAIAVRDVEGWKNYLTTRFDAANGVFERVIADARQVTELGQGYINEAKEIMEGALTTR